MVLARFEPFFALMESSSLAPWVPLLRHLSSERIDPRRHGDLPAWLDALGRLPDAPSGRIRLDADCVGIEAATAADPRTRELLHHALEALHPWRKGPFCLFGDRIDAEWRSDWKWRRVQRAVGSLRGKRVLDVGCGNGYYGFRALGAGADLVLGVDPTLRFVMQFLAMNHFLRTDRFGVLPLADTDLPMGADFDARFDLVLSMGVLYHRRDVMAHLQILGRMLAPGGTLLLETLVLDEPGERTLHPKGRYARMRNVHAIPSLEVLRAWLGCAGFDAVSLVDLTHTSVEEQRATPWMRFQSLADFLDPSDSSRTVEGHPAPCRAMLTASRRGV